MGYGVVVAAHEVVKASLGIHIVATVTEGVEVADMGWAGDCVAVAVCYRCDIAPAVVGVFCSELAVAVVNTDYVSPTVVGVIICKLLPVRVELIAYCI